MTSFKTQWSFEQDILQGQTNFSRMHLINIDFRCLKSLEGFNFVESRFENCIFPENLQRVNFSWANLQAHNFQGKNLQGAIFTHAKMMGANFVKANASGANFYEGILTGANFGESDLENVNFSSAILIKCNFAWANLINANLSQANLELANLTGADVYGTNLEKAFLSKQTELSLARMPLDLMPKLKENKLTFWKKLLLFPVSKFM